MKIVLTVAFYLFNLFEAAYAILLNYNPILCAIVVVFDIGVLISVCLTVRATRRTKALDNQCK